MSYDQGHRGHEWDAEGGPQEMTGVGVLSWEVISKPRREECPRAA